MTLNQKTKKQIGIGAIFVVVMMLAGWLVYGKLLDRLQLQVSSLLYQTRQSGTPILIVGVDQQTTDQMGSTASWTRDNYAQAIQNISKYNPAVIGLDYYFTTASKVIPTAKLTEILTDTESTADIGTRLSQLTGSTELNQYDQSLADEVKDNTKLVMIYPPRTDFSESNLLKQNFISAQPLEAFKPMDKTRIGLINVLTEADGSVRKYIPLMLGDENYLSLGMAVIATYLNATDMRIVSYSANKVEIDFGGKIIKIPLNNYQMMINFAEKNLHAESLKQANEANKNMQYMHFVDAYNDNFSDIDAAALAGKIVLIGPYVQNNDNYKVPIDSDYRMAGVQLHAEAIQTVLDQAWLRDMSTFEAMAVIGLLAALVLLLIYKLPILFALIGVAVLSAFYTLMVGPWAFRNGLIIDLINPPVAVILTSIIAYAYRYLTEFRQKTVAADALEKYVNKEVAEKVLEEEAPVVTGVEKREISVIFTDIKGFTTISEKLRPVSLVTLLNEYFEVMCAIITKNGGTVDKYEGDAIMALFGAPVASTEHAAQACATALEMRAALPALQEKWAGKTLPGGEAYPEIDFRVGISSGEAVIGNIGSSEHLSYTAIGDMVNLGSRLESANKKYQTHIMIAGPTEELVLGKYECRYMDKIRVKGKDRGVMIYELICPHGQLSAEQIELITLYNKAIGLYYEKKFVESLQVLETGILSRWPQDNLSLIYAGRCEVLKRYPPADGWDFIYTMEGK